MGFCEDLGLSSRHGMGERGFVAKEAGAGRGSADGELPKGSIRGKERLLTHQGSC